MKVWLRSLSVRLFVLSFLFSVSVQAGSGGYPAPGLYEHSKHSPLIDLIDSAQHMIDIEIYSMEDPLVRKALLNAIKDDVKIRIIQERNPVGGNCDIFEENPGTDDAACASLKAFRANIIKAGGTYEPFSKRLCGSGNAACVQHGKMILIDARVAMLSSGNFNSSSICNLEGNATRCNRDYSYVIHYLPAVKILGQVFERDLRAEAYDLEGLLSRSGGEDLTVSPFSMDPIIDFIRSAKKSISIQHQYLKDPTMNAAILDAAKRGVKVQINVASACAFGPPNDSAAKAWTKTYSAFEAAGAKVRIFTSSIRVGGMPGYMHAKAILVDGTTAWVGSVNGSTQALEANREFGVFFDGENDIRLLASTMQNDFKNPDGETWQESLRCLKDKDAEPLELSF